MNLPAARGRKILLRPLDSRDAAALAEAVASTRAVLKRRFRWARGEGGGEEEAASFIREAERARERGLATTWGAFSLKRERFLGVLRLGPIDADAYKAEISLWIRAGEQDKGYAADAGRLALEHAFRRMGLHRLYARIDPANRSARKVLKKLGFRYEGSLRDDKRLNARWLDQECWGLLRGEWKK